MSLRSRLLSVFLCAPSVALLASPARADRPFDKGSWALELDASCLSGMEGFFNDRVRGQTGSLALGYYYADNWAISLQAEGSHFSQDFGPDNDYDVAGAALNLLGRWHFINHDRWSLFLDGGGGLARFDDEYPALGTHTNFTARLGLGATLQLSDHCHLVGGVRYFHLSNAARHGQDENPNLNAAEGYIGVMFTF